MNKMSLKTLFSSKTTEWATPQKIFDELDKEFGFTLDPCATEENAKCEKFFTVKEDGLKQCWDNDTVFMNPPYGREIYGWIGKAVKSKGVVVMLLPVRTDTRWFHDHKLMDYEIRFIRGRLKFGDSKSSAPFPSMVVVKR